MSGTLKTSHFSVRSFLSIPKNFRKKKNRRIKPLASARGRRLLKNLSEDFSVPKNLFKDFLDFRKFFLILHHTFPRCTFSKYFFPILYAFSKFSKGVISLAKIL